MMYVQMTRRHPLYAPFMPALAKLVMFSRYDIVISHFVDLTVS